MDIIYAMVPIGFLLMLVALFAFIFAIRSKQYDDLDSDAQRIILDDAALQRNIKKNKQEKS